MQESWEELREGQAFHGQQWRGEREKNEQSPLGEEDSFL
jgi:hypothetical protein